MRVVVADSDAESRANIVEHLTNWGYIPVEAATGTEAMDILSRPEVIRVAVLDHALPGIDGFSLCNWLNGSATEDAEGNEWDRPPVGVYTLLLTDAGNRPEFSLDSGLGPDDFVDKPVDPLQLEYRLFCALRVVDAQQQIRKADFDVRLECLTALAQIAEARAKEKVGHMRRVGALAGCLAQAVGMPEPVVSDMTLFTQFHDIGKLSVPETILRAERQLSAEEYDIVKSHTLLGAEILATAPGLELAVEIAYTHHERWDGDGYPAGIKGDQIPVSGRIAAIADAYDALRSDRSFRAGWSAERAAEFIVSEAGWQFDPELVEVFQRSQEQLEALFEEMSESA